MMTRLKARLVALGRIGLLVALAGLAVTLVASGWSSRREAERLSALLDRSQAERFFRPIPRIHELNRGAATESQLGRLLEQFQDEGLRYIAELGPDGAVLARAGEPSPVDRERASTVPTVIGDRVRVVFRPPRGAPDPSDTVPRAAELDFLDGDGPPPRPRDRDRDRVGPRFPLPDLLLEFEPTVSNQLRSRADSAFVFSAAAALSLLALTLGLWLSLQREAKQRERRERERQLAVLGEMSAVLAHEIRNPLASLKGTAQLLGEQLEPTSPLQKKVTRIVGEAKRLEDLSASLLDLVRSSTVDPKPLDPRELVLSVVQTLSAERIVVDAGAAPQTFSLDALRFEQVLKNLLQNALQATPEGAPPVEVWVGAERGQLKIHVRDHGAGLPVGSEQAIFEPFHTTRAQGTGLGLAVARRIVELHGGKLTAENHREGGAIFRLVIP